MSEEDYKAGYRDGIVAGEVNRAAVIEECARVAEEYSDFPSFPAHKAAVAESIATAIRALKEKP